MPPVGGTTIDRPRPAQAQASVADPPAKVENPWGQFMDSLFDGTDAILTARSVSTNFPGMVTMKDFFHDFAKAYRKNRYNEDGSEKPPAERTPIHKLILKVGQDRNKVYEAELKSGDAKGWEKHRGFKLRNWMHLCYVSAYFLGKYAGKGGSSGLKGAKTVGKLAWLIRAYGLSHGIYVNFQTAQNIFLKKDIHDFSSIHDAKNNLQDRLKAKHPNLDLSNPMNRFEALKKCSAEDVGELYREFLVDLSHDVAKLEGLEKTAAIYKVMGRHSHKYHDQEYHDYKNGAFLNLTAPEKQRALLHRVLQGSVMSDANVKKAYAAAVVGAHILNFATLVPEWKDKTLFKWANYAIIWNFFGTTFHPIDWNPNTPGLEYGGIGSV